MKKVVFLDTGVLTNFTNPRASAEVRDCLVWVREILTAGNRVCIAEICDYEARRDMLHRKATRQLQLLDGLKSKFEFVAIDRAVMLRAAELWADGRARGRPTAGDKSLDADAVLCAQASLNVGQNEELVVATTDVGDLSTFVRASKWRSISP